MTIRNQSDGRNLEIDLYGPAKAASVLEKGRIAALGRALIKIPPGESITVDFGYVRFASKRPSNGEKITEPTSRWIFPTMARVSAKSAASPPETATATASGGAPPLSRYFRLTMHEASSQGAVVNELKLRILNKDRMPIGQLERAARAGRGDLYPQALLGRQVYWTVLGQFNQTEEALFDEYGNLEPQAGFGQITPMLRLGGALHGAPESAAISQSLVDGSLPIPSVTCSVLDVELRATALVHAGEALVEYRITNRSVLPQEGSARPRRAPCPNQSLLATWRPRRHQRHRRRRQAGVGQ